MTKTWYVKLEFFGTTSRKVPQREIAKVNNQILPSITEPNLLYANDGPTIDDFESSHETLQICTKRGLMETLPIWREIESTTAYVNKRIENLYQDGLPLARCDESKDKRT
eukprot:621374-Hanusia_phi.AAC.1